ncbi:uncharacterized protein [Euwallacea fornicatus]|uniref:uncharacterized protein n=1 Tax=Euwallacea fornicatus TaxID=995702 RepID=UPI00338F9622
MWKFVTILILATSTASPLQVTPEQLHNHFDVIQNDTQKMQYEYFEYGFWNYWLQFSVRINDLKVNLISEMLTHIVPYQDAMTEIFDKFINQDIDMLECIQAVNEKQRNVSENIITTTKNNFTDILDQFVAKLNKYVITMDESFKELEDEILACNDSTCATDLDAQLDKLYAKMQDDIKAILTEEVEIYEIIDNIHLDKTYYDALIQSLIDELQLCVN